MEDKSLIVEFYKKTLNDGRNADCIKISVIGDPSQVFEGLADATYIAQYPREWEIYQNNQPDCSGTPLSEIDFRREKLSQSSMVRLNSIGIFTVEHLSNTPDHLLHKLGMSGKELRDTAREYIEKNKAQENKKQTSDELKKSILSSLTKEDIMALLKDNNNLVEDAPKNDVKTDVEQEEIPTEVKRKGRPPKK